MKYPKYKVGDIVKGFDTIRAYHFLIMDCETSYKVVELLSGMRWEFNYSYLDDSPAAWLAA